MEIIYYFRQQQTPMYLWQNVHFIDELKRNNIHVEIFNPINYENITIANEELIKKMKKKKYDLFMTCHNEQLLFIRTLISIKDMKIPTLLICYDNLLIPYEHKKVCTYFDLVWLTAMETKRMFDKWGAKTIFAPYAANPYTYKYYDEGEENNRIVFNGTPYGSRANIINTLSKSGIQIDVYSNLNGGRVVSKKHSFFEYIQKFLRFASFSIGRKVLQSALIQKLSHKAVIEENDYLRIKSSVEFSEISKLYSRYAVSLSSTSARDTGILKKPVNVLVLRTFEIPMSGGILFCEYTDELAKYFEDGKEVILYRNTKEMLEKAKILLSPEYKGKRDEIRKNARIRAERDHTWMKRFELIFKELGIHY